MIHIAGGHTDPSDLPHEIETEAMVVIVITEQIEIGTEIEKEIDRSKGKRSLTLSTVASQFCDPFIDLYE